MRRTKVFCDLDSDTNEFLAQAITYACIADLQSSQLRTVFNSLEARQPPSYVIPTDIKDRISTVNWPLTLEAAREEVDAFRGEGSFSMYAGLVALARLTVEKSSEEQNEMEWNATLTDEQAISSLKNNLVYESKNLGGKESLDYLIDRFNGLKVEVFAREHPPPHFRVVCGGESANYTIKDCRQLNGGLRNVYRTIRKWHEAHRGDLIAAWNQYRPSDCPVGEYREG